MTPAPGSWIEVDRSALRHNLRVLREHTGLHPRILVPVKADGYGHGAVETARCVLQNGADRVGVARIAEGIQLREQGIEGIIHVLEPFHPGDVELYAQYRLIATVCDTVGAQALSDYGRKHSVLTAHLKVDTGMARLGLHHRLQRTEILSILALPAVKWEGIFTHFARADEQNAHTAHQLELFQEVLQDLETWNLRPALAHAANSAATLFHPSSHLDMVRPGIAVYGLDPSHGTLPHACKLKPALRLYSSIRHLAWKDAGEEVSYGGMWTTPRRTLLATLPLGYGDGFWRSHSGRIDVAVGGVLCPQVGRICMDLMMVDVTDVPGVHLDQKIAIIDEQAHPSLSALRLANNQSTIVYEVTCDLGRRLERRFVD